MENLTFALNATLPVFLVMLLGALLRKVGILHEGFCKDADQYVFKVALPVSLFNSVSQMDFYSDFDPKFCLFCFLSTTVIFLGVWGLTWLLMKDKTLVGAFAQAAARSSAAILGIAFVTNIYGNAGMVPMMILSAVPFFNIYAVLILTFSPHCDEEGRLLPPEAGGGSAVKRACLGVLKNHIILGILLGFPFSLLRIQLPTFLSSALSTVGATATPVALLVIGATFSGAKAIRLWKPTLTAGLIKLVVLPALFLPLAALLGFRGSALVAILIMTGSPTTVSCYVMAVSMKNNGTLTSSVVVLTTLLSSVTITLWLYGLKVLGMI